MIYSFHRASIFDKLNNIESDVSSILNITSAVHTIPIIPARDVEIKPTKDHPPKLGFSVKEGQARALHDLASIELQAMELGLRTLAEFPEADLDFRKQLADLTLSEAEHLKLCLNAIEELGYKWGDWPIHTTLWNCTDSSDSLLERIFIVHRYLEGSGLDAGAYICQRLAGVPDAKLAYNTVLRINTEEIDHVQFGSRWFQKLTQEQKLNTEEHFKNIILKLQPKLPKRVEKVNHQLRLKSGFSEFEINELNLLRDRFLSGEIANLNKN